MKAIKFKNFTGQDFTYSFDSIPYTFRKGETMFLEDYKAEHFAKHLIDRELNATNTPTNNMSARAKLEKLCFPSDEVVTPQEALNINEVEKEVKEKKTKKVKKVEVEFEDLNK